MTDRLHKPVLIVIAGPNGSGKTTITSKILHHEWLEDAVYINPDIIARYNRPIANCHIASKLADRTYVYDNSVENAEAQLLFRMVNGKLVRTYVNAIPEWAQTVLGTDSGTVHVKG